MNFTNLQYFRTVAEELNFTKAAQKLYISQQSLSNHIKRLEDEYQVLLFNRTPNLTLTEAGKSLYENSIKILTAKANAVAELNDIRDFKSSQISIGIHQARAHGDFSQILKKYHETYPQVKINLFEGTHQVLAEELKKQTIDLAMCVEFPPNDFLSIKLYNDRQYIVMSREIYEKYCDFSLDVCNREKAGTFDLFLKCPFVSCNIGTWTGYTLNALATRYKAQLNVSVNAHTFLTMVELCRIGLGAGLMSDVIMSDEMRNQKDLMFFLLDEPEVRRNMFFYMNNNVYHSKALSKFINLSLEYYRHSESVHFD